MNMMQYECEFMNENCNNKYPVRRNFFMPDFVMGADNGFFPRDIASYLRDLVFDFLKDTHIESNWFIENDDFEPDLWLPEVVGDVLLRAFAFRLEEKHKDNRYFVNGSRCVKNAAYQLLRLSKRHFF